MRRILTTSALAAFALIASSLRAADPAPLLTTINDTTAAPEARRNALVSLLRQELMPSMPLEDAFNLLGQVQCITPQSFYTVGASTGPWPFKGLLSEWTQIRVTIGWDTGNHDSLELLFAGTFPAMDFATLLKRTDADIVPSPAQPQQKNGRLIAATFFHRIWPTFLLPSPQLNGARHSEGPSAQSSVHGVVIANLIENDAAAELTKLLSLGLSPDAWVFGFGDPPGLGGPIEMTMLEYACNLNQSRVIKALLAAGASRDASRCGKLPIELLFASGDKTLAPLLAKPDTELPDHELLEMIGIRLLRHATGLLKRYRTAADYHSIRFNGKPISNAMLTILSGGKFGTLPEPKNAPANDALACTLDVQFTDIFDRDKISFRLETGGPLSGGVAEGRYQLQFGYWLLKETEFSDR
jgi:hypothetical protein